MIFGDVLTALEAGRSPILLTERKDHARHFAERLDRFARNVILLQGGMGTRQRREIMQRLEDIPETHERILVATGRYVGEGFDDARLDTLFLAMPVSWRGKLALYVGRLHRLHPAKREVLVYDYVDGAEARGMPTLREAFEDCLKADPGRAESTKTAYRALQTSISGAGSLARWTRSPAGMWRCVSTA